MKVAKETVNKLTKLRTAMLDSAGREINNPQPMQVPIGLTTPRSLRDEIKAILREEVSQQAVDQKMESWEEANDFEVTDDFEAELVESKYTLVTEEFDAKVDNPFIVEEEPEPVSEKPVKADAKDKEDEAEKS